MGILRGSNAVLSDPGDSVSVGIRTNGVKDAEVKSRS